MGCAITGVFTIIAIKMCAIRCWNSVDRSSQVEIDTGGPCPVIFRRIIKGRRKCTFKKYELFAEQSYCHFILNLSLQKII